MDSSDCLPIQQRYAESLKELSRRGDGRMGEHPPGVVLYVAWGTCDQYELPVAGAPYIN
jgi:hypothetical protein